MTKHGRLRYWLQKPFQNFSFKTIFAIPDGLTLEDHWRAVVLRVFSLMAFAMCAIGLVLVVPQLDQSLPTFLLTVVLVCILALTVFLLMKWRNISAASLVMTWGLWLVLLFLSLNSPGLNSFIYLTACLLLPLIVGFVKGTVWSVATYLIFMLVGVWFAYQEANGIIEPIGNVYEPWARLSAYLIIFGALPVFVYMRDVRMAKLIHKVKVAEEAQLQAAEAQRQNDALIITVSQRTEELETALKREHHLAFQLKNALAKEAELSQLKSRVIDVISHEFRTPLTIINSSSELLEEFGDQLSPEKQAAYRRRIKDSIFRLKSLLDDVTLMNRSTNRRLEINIRPFLGNELGETLQELLSEQVEDGRLQFTLLDESSIPFQTDDTLVCRILDAVLSNSLKFSPPDSVVEVTLLQRNAYFRAIVEDQGIGILPEDQPHVFDLLYRGQNAESTPGLGIGLQIAAQITETLNGRISITSPGENAGARVVLTIPNDALGSEEDFMVPTE